MNAEDAVQSLHDLDDLLDGLEPARRTRLEREAAEACANLESAPADQPKDESAALALSAPRAVATLHADAKPEAIDDTQADANASDEQLVALWLHGRAPLTTRAYRRDAGRFRAFVGKPLRIVTLGDLQAFADSLDGQPGTRARILSAVKSMLSFASKIGALRFNVGAALRSPARRDGLADRIITEAEVARMLALTEGRNHALVRLAYAGGLRVAELVGVKWVDLANADDGTLFVTVTGKGGKVRTVRVSAATGNVLRALRGDAPSGAHVFAGRGGKKSLNPSQAWRIVRAAARRAGIEKNVSPHFLRHAHASHALERGVKVTVIRDTLGHSSIAITDLYAHARPEESSGLALAV